LQGSLAKQWAATEKQAHGFNDTLKAGGGPAKTYSAILADMLGGATGLNTGLALTGPNMGTFSKNVTDIGKASAEANGHVKGWALTQQDFSVKMDQAKASVAAMAVKIGTALIPSVQSLLSDGVQLSTWLSKHTAVTWAIVGALGAFATVSIAVKVANLASATATSVWAAATGIATAAQWLLNAALTANPIGLVVVAVAALVGVIILIATKTTWFQTVWGVMTDALATAWRWLWNSILAPIIRFVLNGFASITDGIANMLRVLSNIPGFGWAKDAANKMAGAADKAHALANGIKDIPAKVPVVVSFSSNFSWVAQQILSLQNAKNKLAANPPGHALGGLIGGTGTGDTELGLLTPGEFIIRRDGSNIADALNHFGAKAATPVAGFDYDRMAAAMSRAQIVLDGKNVARSVDQRLAPR